MSSLYAETRKSAKFGIWDGQELSLREGFVPYFYE